MIIKILLFVAFVLILLVLFTLYAHGKAYEWMSDRQNVKKLHKHYSLEGINTHVVFSDRCVEVSFHHKGRYYARSITFVQAMAHMEKTPNGGIRERLVKTFK